MRKFFLCILAAVLTLPAFAQWTTSGTDIYNSNTGNVGVGTNTPPRKLTVSNNGNEGLEIGPGNLVGDPSNAVTSVYYNRNAGAFIDNVQMASSHSFAISGVTPSMHINSSGKVGIGTTSPSEKLTIVGNSEFKGSAPYLALTSSSWSGPAYLQTGVDATGATNGNYFGFLNPAGKGFSFSQYGVVKLIIDPTNGNVGIGTTYVPNDYKLAVNGAAIATSMNVMPSGSWPDFVFLKDYKLPTLAEVKTYIDKNRHLPDMPSANDVHTNGVDLGEMNRLLLKKVEELTLYLIKKDEQVKEQQKINRLQQKQIDEINAQLNALAGK
ncbi:flagellar export protein FliJ [Mucilaginibacter calamicampi]|uniref:Flagellar export protein FliJ n=1 Tax=Mucilaginibacter calamicampi TaxID=1302352 RepID=A0ABW2YSM2_9SPHI